MLRDSWGESWSQAVASAAKTLGTFPQWPDIVAGHTVSHPLYSQLPSHCTPRDRKVALGSAA